MTKMGMIQWMCDHMRLDRIRSEVIKRKVKVEQIKVKMRVAKFKWFGHVKGGVWMNLHGDMR